MQLGGCGSAMGVIGMWTGVEHNPENPIGLCFTNTLLPLPLGELTISLLCVQVVLSPFGA